MSLWAIDYALDLKAMKEAGYSREDAAGFCAAVEACFAERHFAKLERLGLHASDRDDALSDAYLTCLDLSAIADSDKFIRRLHLFRISDATDLLHVLSAGKASSSGDPVREEIAERYSDQAQTPDPSQGLTPASTLAAVIQDLFLDGTGQDEKKPRASFRKPSAKPS